MAGNCGVTMELCAGIVDKQARLADIAREEVMEECGYEIKTETLEQVITFRFVYYSLSTIFFCHFFSEHVYSPNWKVILVHELKKKFSKVVILLHTVHYGSCHC